MVNQKKQIFLRAWYGFQCRPNVELTILVWRLPLAQTLHGVCLWPCGLNPQIALFIGKTTIIWQSIKLGVADLKTNVHIRVQYRPWQFQWQRHWQFQCQPFPILTSFEPIQTNHSGSVAQGLNVHQASKYSNWNSSSRVPDSEPADSRLSQVPTNNTRGSNLHFCIVAKKIMKSYETCDLNFTNSSPTFGISNLAILCCGELFLAT